MINAYAADEPNGTLKPFEYDPGVLAEHDVEIDIEYCGICHSDLSMIDNEWGMSEYPLVAGHEAIGTISLLGAKVSHLKLGDAVGLGWHAGYCMTCHACLSGDHNLCASSQGTIVSRHGAFADKVRASAVSVIKLPDHIDKETAGPLFCGGITVFNPLVQFNISSTDKVAVVGVGGLGHMALQFLNAWGCKVTAFTSTIDKKKELLEMGAHEVISSSDSAELESVAGQFDYIISTVNVKLDWNAILNTLKSKGRLHFVGATLDPLDINAMSLIMGQRSISGSPVGSPATIAKMLNFAVQHNIKPVVEKFNFNDINKALDRLRSGNARYRIVLCRE
ncbi:MAG: NAD(P)-dependent alcohol dehydrogenase [Thiohalomonadales bacterium]